MIFASRQKKVEELVGLYCRTVLDCMDAFKESVVRYCNDPDRKRIKEEFAQVHKTESLADDMRREIEVMMYSKALFPESRGDMLGLLETMDRVPNHAESAVQMVHEQHIVIPEEYVAGIVQLVDVCYRCVEAMLDSVDKLYEDYTNATVAVGRIDELETEADHIESELTERVFGSDLDGLQKILLRDLIKHIAGICDRAENVGDRIRIIVAKRGV